MAVYVTQLSDTIDSIVWRFYGQTRGHVERVLGANPDLALQPEFLPAGVRIELPEPPVVETVRPVLTLWE